MKYEPANLLEFEGIEKEEKMAFESISDRKINEE